MIEVTAETEFFWSELADGRLIVRRCTTCGETQAYPRRLCVRCGGEAAEWVTLPAQATVYSFTDVAAPPPDRPHLTGPFTLAIVEFDGGHRMMGTRREGHGHPANYRAAPALCALAARCDGSPGLRADRGRDS